MKKSLTLACSFLIWGGCSGHATGESWAGKIVIDGVEFGSKNSSVIVGNGRPVTQKRMLSCFDRINVDATVDIVYQHGPTCEVRISADSNLIDAIEFAVSGRTLAVKSKRSFETSNPVMAEIVSPTLGTLKMLSASDAELRSVQAPSLALDLTGSGDIRADGTVDVLQVTTAGSSTLELKELKAEKAAIRISGSSDATIFASDTLSVEIEGVGDVLYYGRPNSVKKRISGVGSVEAVN